MLNFLILLAEDAPAPKPTAPIGFELLLPLGLVFLFWFLVLRPMKRQEQDQRLALLKNLKKNDDVMTAGGIYGTVVSVNDQDEHVVVKVDDNVRLRIAKTSITRNITNEKAAKAAKEKKEGAA